MFEGKTLWDIVNMGGFTMYILIFCSVLSLAVIVDRLFNYFRRSRMDKLSFMKKIQEAVEKGQVDQALLLCEKGRAPFCSVVRMGLKNIKHEEKVIQSAMEREIMLETVLLERYTTIVGTIGNIAVYIGLFGTVLGIVNSFHNIARIGSGGISTVIGGVSEALICTATGLLVAIPAVVAYNYFLRRIDRFTTEMQYCASATLDLITLKKS